MPATDENAEAAPGPSAMELPGWATRFVADNFGTAVEFAETYRPVGRMPASPEVFLTSSPDAAKHVLQDNHRNYRKADAYDHLKPLVGEGLITSEGDLWMRQRRLVAPMFHADRVHAFVETMREVTADTLETLAEVDDGETIEVVEEMSRVTLSNIGRFLFGRDIGRETEWLKEAVDTVLEDVSARTMASLRLPHWVPTPNNVRVRDMIEALEKYVFELIDERRGEADEHDDLLSLLMLAEDDETGETMSDDQIRDEALTFILAGQETTMNLLSWTFYLLSEHPDERRRVEEEVDRIVSGAVPTLEELAALDFTEQVLDESLRYYPPAWSIGRTPIEDDVIEGYRIPAGSILWIGPYFVHHNDEVWDTPDTFAPDRFGPDGDVPDHRYAHFPFGGGPRKCVGGDFAIQQAKLVVAAVARRFRLDLADNHPVEPAANVTITPRYGLEMTVESRSEPEPI